MDVFSASSCVVIDAGEDYTKCGFAGEAAPRRIVRTRFHNSLDDAEVTLTQSTPPRSYQDWLAAWAALLSRLYFQHLLTNPKDRRVIICQNAFWPYAMKQALARALFDLGAPGLLFLPPHALPLYTTGQQAGLVLDVGASEARAMPVFGGFPMHSCLRTAPIGAKSVRQALREAVAVAVAVQGNEGGDGDDNAAALREASAYEVASVVAQACVVRAPHQDVNAPVQAKPLVVAMGGRRKVTVPAAARVQSADALFGVNEEGASLAEVVLQALLACPTEVRAAVSQNLVLAGGTSSLPGLPRRLLAEINSLLAEDARYAPLAGLTDKVRLAEPMFPPQVLSWVGAAMIGALGLAQDMFLTPEAAGVSVGSDSGVAGLQKGQTRGKKKGERDRRKPKVPDWMLQGLVPGAAPPQPPSQRHVSSSSSSSSSRHTRNTKPHARGRTHLPSSSQTR